MTKVDLPKSDLFRSGKSSRYLCKRRDRRLETTPEVGLLRQRLTYDTFWRRFYAVLTTRWRIRNDWHMIHFGGDFTLSSQRSQEFATIDIWYILAEILRCPHNEVKNSQRWTEYWNCKVGFGFSRWMLVVNFKCWNVKLKVGSIT